MQFDYIVSKAVNNYLVNELLPHTTESFSCEVQIVLPILIMRILVPEFQMAPHLS